MGDLLKVALLGSKFYPRPYALGSRLKLFKRIPLAAGGNFQPIIAPGSLHVPFYVLFLHTCELQQFVPMYKFGGVTRKLICGVRADFDAQFVCAFYDKITPSGGAYLHEFTPRAFEHLFLEIHDIQQIGAIDPLLF